MMKRLMLCAIFMVAIGLTTTVSAQEPQKPCTVTGQCCQKSKECNQKSECPVQCPSDKKQCCTANGQCPQNCTASCENPKACCKKNTSDKNACKQACNKPCKQDSKTR